MNNVHWFVFFKRPTLDSHYWQSASQSVLKVLIVVLRVAALTSWVSCAHYSGKACWGFEARVDFVEQSLDFNVQFCVCGLERKISICSKVINPRHAQKSDCKEVLCVYMEYGHKTYTGTALSAQCFGSHLIHLS